MVTKKKKVQDMSENEKNLTPVYARAAMQNPVPKYELPWVSLTRKRPTT